LRLHEAGFLVRRASRAFAEEVAAFAVSDKPFAKVCKRRILHKLRGEVANSPVSKTGAGGQW
jgi:hypothetical protein